MQRNPTNDSSVNFISLFFSGRGFAFLCRQLVTLTVGGGIELAIHVSPGSNNEGLGEVEGEVYRDTTVSGLSGLRLRNVRIVVKGGAMLSVGMTGDYSSDDMEYGLPGEGTSALTLEGAASQVCSTNTLLAVPQLQY